MDVLIKKQMIKVLVHTLNRKGTSENEQIAGAASFNDGVPFQVHV